MDITSRVILLLPHGFLLHRNMYKFHSVGVTYFDLAKAFDSLSQTFILMKVKHFSPDDAFVCCFEAHTTAQEYSKMSSRCPWSYRMRLEIYVFFSLTLGPA